MKVRVFRRKSEFIEMSAEVTYSRRLERWRRRGLESRKCSRIRPLHMLNLELWIRSLVRACMIWHCCSIKFSCPINPLSRSTN
jgi:hypothetical protein